MSDYYTCLCGVVVIGNQPHECIPCSHCNETGMLFYTPNSKPKLRPAYPREIQELGTRNVITCPNCEGTGRVVKTEA